MATTFYLFVFSLVDDHEKIQLTDSAHSIQINRTNDQIFLPKSNIKLKEANFNDCGEVRITLEGVYEKEGIQPNHRLLGSIVEISTIKLQDNQVTPIASCTCIKIEEFITHFRIYLVSNTHKLHNRITQRYSQSCRATFGDQMCTMDLNKISEEYEISHILGKIIYFKAPIATEKHSEGYYDNGTALIDSSSRRVIKHSLEEVTKEDRFNLELVVLESSLSDFVVQKFQAKKVLKIRLMPGCNKTFFTCNTTYKNAINFQGEPFLS